jgi:hypothetical protein
MLSLLAAFASCECPDLPTYFRSGSRNFIIPPEGWQYFYANHPQDATPLRMWVHSEKPILVAAETIPSCPNETTVPFLQTDGGNTWIEGKCTLRSANRVLTVGIYSQISQIVQVKLREDRRMSFGMRKFIELGCAFLGLTTVALIFFCCYVLPRPKIKQV